MNISDGVRSKNLHETCNSYSSFVVVFLSKIVRKTTTISVNFDNVNLCMCIRAFDVRGKYTIWWINWNECFAKDPFDCCDNFQNSCFFFVSGITKCQYPHGMFKAKINVSSLQNCQHLFGAMNEWMFIKSISTGYC